MIQAEIEKLKKSPLVYIAWKVLGSPIPPPHVVKQRAVKSYGRLYHINTFVETGTYLGDMVYALRNDFKKIYTIELSDYYYNHSRTRLKGAKNIKIIKGDSGKIIKKVLQNIRVTTLFWLDGHYSNGKTAKTQLNTPILRELKTILQHKVKSHVILIDDAREFIGKNDYPKISQIRKMSAKHYHLEVKDDIIRLTPIS